LATGYQFFLSFNIAIFDINHKNKVDFYKYVFLTKTKTTENTDPTVADIKDAPLKTR
jgi:hypothetical protein